MKLNVSTVGNTPTNLKEHIEIIINLTDKKYVNLNDQCVGKIISDFYIMLYTDVYENGCTDLLIDFIPLIERLSEQDKDTVQSYLFLIFPIYLKNGAFKFKRIGIYKRRKEKWYAKLAKLKERMAPENFIDFPTFKKINSEFNGVKLHQIEALIDLFGSIDQVSKLLKKSLKWPSTDIAISIRSIFKTGWISSGLLSSEGYHVGNIGLDCESRKVVLKDIIFKEFTEEDDFMDDDYINTWSSPGTLPRLLKLARTIAALCRNAKRSSHDYTNAINDWESDLAYLKTEFYEPWIQNEAIGQAIEQLKWPETAV